MARWIDQTLHISEDAEIVLKADAVIVQIANNQGWDGYATFQPSNWEDATSMALALRLAAKHLEGLWKGQA